jgi:RNA polymerase sigma-70 factor (ECF subfamily)
MGVADDAELMRRWQRGESAALSALVERWQMPVARFLTRLVGPDRAADLCQETFLRVLRTGDRYREQGTFSTWLFQVALNVARDANRRKTPMPSAELYSQFAESAEESVERNELNQTVTAAVDELPANLREVLALRHDAGMNFESMARLLGTPASTLKSRFAVALSRVRHRLAEMGYQAEETHP